MIVLGVSVVLMFSVSVASLATTQSLQEKFLLKTWIRLSNDNKIALQDSLNCCGFNNESQNNSESNYHPSCRTKPLVLQALGVGSLMPSRVNYDARVLNLNSTCCEICVF